MTLRFFGAQRCGATGNWALAGHDSAKGGEVCHTRDGQSAGVDLTGGWHDCGDHWKVCFTMGFAAYTLLKAYDVFPRGRLLTGSGARARASHAHGVIIHVKGND